MSNVRRHVKNGTNITAWRSSGWLAQRIMAACEHQDRFGNSDDESAGGIHAQSIRSKCHRASRLDSSAHYWHSNSSHTARLPGEARLLQHGKARKSASSSRSGWLQSRTTRNQGKPRISGEGQCDRGSHSCMEPPVLFGSPWQRFFEHFDRWSFLICGARAGISGGYYHPVLKPPSRFHTSRGSCGRRDSRLPTLAAAGHGCIGTWDSLVPVGAMTSNHSIELTRPGMPGHAAHVKR